MSLAQHYRSQAIDRQRRCFRLCGVAALAFHGGAIAAIALGKLPLLPQLAEQPEPEPLPLEFVDLDLPPAETKPTESDRLAQIDSIAGGTHQSESPVAADSFNLQPSVPKPPIVPSAAKPPSGTPSIAAESTIPVVSTQKAVETPAVKDPEVTPDAVSEAVPTLEAANPVLPTQPAIEPSAAPSPTVPSPTVPSPTSSSAVPLPNASAATPAPLFAPPLSAANLTSELGATSDLPLEAEGILNPDRTADDQPAGVTAKQDELWGAYVAALNQEIEDHWQRIPVETTREVKVRFAVNRQGELTTLELLEDADDPAANQAALEAVQSAAPFQPLPEAAPEDVLVINFTFTYHVARRN